jgi:Protein of unknown function (DUF2637)
MNQLLRHAGAWLADSGPVLILALIAGAGSFDHIHATAAAHGQRGPMSWAVAVCIDLTSVMAARELQRDRRTHRRRRPVSWPLVVLAAGVVLSVAANLDQAQPTTWGRITAATPAAAFLISVSMIERRAGQTAARSPVPAVTPGPVRVPDDGADVAPVPVPSLAVLPGPAPPTRPDAELLTFARQVAAEHHDSHGTPITRDALRARLGVSNQLASDLLREIRTTQPAKESAHA